MSSPFRGEMDGSKEWAFFSDWQLDTEMYRLTAKGGLMVIFQIKYALKCCMAPVTPF